MTESTFGLLEATTPTARIEALGRFLDYWFGKRRPEYGDDDEALDRLPLPAPLRQFYALAGRRPSADPDSLEQFYTGGGGHHLRALEDVTRREDGRLDFFMEYQGDWEGVTLAEGDDPPVWLTGCFEYDDEPDDAEEGRRVCDSLSRFLVTHVLMATLYESENAPCSIFATKGPLVDRFHETFGGPSELIWDTRGIDWPESCVPYEGEFYLLRFSGGILAHKNGKMFRFGALRPGAISIMIGDLMRGEHRVD